MPSDNYKNWIITALLAILLGILIIFFLGRSHKTETPVERPVKRGPVTGPLLDTDEEKRMLLEQIEKGNADPEALAALGDKYFENSRFDLALEIYEKVLELNPSDVDTYNDMGLALHYTGKSDRAVEILRKGTDVMPSYQRIWLSLGFVLASTGKNKEARPVLEKAVELAPDTDQGLEAKRLMGFLK